MMWSEAMLFVQSWWSSKRAKFNIVRHSGIFNRICGSNRKVHWNVFPTSRASLIHPWTIVLQRKAFICRLALCKNRWQNETQLVIRWSIECNWSAKMYKDAIMFTKAINSNRPVTTPDRGSRLPARPTNDSLLIPDFVTVWINWLKCFAFIARLFRTLRFECIIRYVVQSQHRLVRILHN